MNSLHTKIGVVFDLDGTILDDIEIIKELPFLLAEAFKVKISDQWVDHAKEDIFEKIGQSRSNFLIIKALVHLAKLMNIPWYKRVKFLIMAKRIFHENVAKAPLVPNALKTIRKIKEKYVYVGIFTTSSKREIKEKFQQRPELLEIFKENIISRDMVKHPKPHPEGLQKLSTKWKIPESHLIMIGDMQNDIIAGKNAGSKTVGVLSGFDTYKDFKKKKADFIIPSIEDLPDLIPKIINDIVKI